MKYRPEIDGLRAIAVLPVILFHAGFTVFSGGYTGVDVFFVISGFLITSIILSELEKGKFSIINFYERRARRILPLLFFILLVSLPFAWISLFNSDMIDYFESLIAVSVFSSNILFVRESGYFDTSVDLKPLLHTWSLAVEEQYYIIFPPLMILCWKFLNKHWILFLLTIISICSFLLSESRAASNPTANFYLLPTRAWELAIGAIIAALQSSQPAIFAKIQSQKIFNEILSGIGLLMIILGVFVINEETPFPSTYTLLPTIGAGFIIIFANTKNIVGSILSTKILVSIGLISYSAYLWHHPLFAFVKHLSLDSPSIIQKTMWCLLVFPLAYLSWKYVENPFRNKKKFSRKFIFIYSFIGSLFFISIGYWGAKSKGFPSRKINTALNIRNYQPDNFIFKQISWNKLEKNTPELATTSWFFKKNKLPNMLLLGNSHSKDLYNILTSSQQAQQYFKIGRYGLNIAELSDMNHLVFSSPSYMDAEIIAIVSRYSDKDMQSIEEAVQRFLQDEKQVIIVKEIHNFEVVNMKTKADLIIQEHIRNGYDLQDSLMIKKVVHEINQAYFNDYISNNIQRKSDKIITSLKTTYPNIIILDRMEYVCNNNLEICFAIDQQLQKYFYDYAHHTLEGVSFFSQKIDEINWIEPIIQQQKIFNQ